ncbi:VWA domain-containing protein [Myxococcota bacterium]|nr:VWA domain-containing protein [Myxococcota bacterium]
MKTSLWTTTLICVSLLALSCSKPPAAPPQPGEEGAGPSVKFEETVATVDPMGQAVTADGSNGVAPFRLLPDREVRTQHHTAVYLDNGVALLLDAASTVKVNAGATKLSAGRAWVRARCEKEWRLELPGGAITAREAAFNVTLTPEGVLLHHLEGELTANFGPKAERLRGGTFLLTGAGPQARPTELWTDWTGGLYRPQKAASGYGVLMGRPQGSIGLGAGNAPLILRRQKVSVKIRHRTAITEVEQVFFNPASSQRDGDYRVKLPDGAVMLDVAVSKRAAQWMTGAAKPIAPAENLVTDGSFFQIGEGDFGALITALPPAAEVGVRMTYAQTLSDIGGRRLYRYPMSGGTRAGDFELSLRVLDANARLRSGWDGSWERLQFVVRKSDFLPLSDFVAEVFPAKADEPLFEVEKDPGDRASFLLSIPLQSVLKQVSGSGARASEPAVVFLLDMSASMDSSKIQVLKTAFASLFEKLGDKTKVAVFVLRGDVTPLDAEGLAPMHEKRRKSFLEAISRLNPAGATDLGLAIEKATVLIPNGEGMILYVGDGQPSRGPMISAQLASRLAMSSPAPLFTSIILGRPGQRNILEPLGRTWFVEEVGELSSRVIGLLQELESAAFKDIKVSLGPKVSRLTPARIPTAAPTDTLFLYGFSEKELPKTALITGYYATHPFHLEIPLTPTVTSDVSVLRKLWAASRLKDLIARGSGFEAIAQLALEYQMITPYTGYSFVYSGQNPDSTQIPSSIYQEIPRLPEYEFAGLRNLPPSSVSGLSLPDLAPPVMDFSIETYYRILLANDDRREAVDQCYQRKAVFAPMAGGIVTFEFTVDIDGRWKKIERKSATITDTGILTCIERALRLAPPLPAPPMGQPVTFTHAFSFASSGQVLPQECSALSRAYIEDRKRAWRQKMPFGGSAYQAENQWKSAEAACELESWTDRRAFLEIMLQKMTDVRQKLAFALLLAPEGTAVSMFIREHILRNIKTPDEARWVVQTLSLNGGQLYGAFLVELDRWYEKDGKKLTAEAINTAVLEIAQKWQRLDPQNAALTLFVMQAAIRANQHDISLRWGSELLSRNDLTAGQREQVAELFMTMKQPILAQLAISTSVEMAPHDPWTRKRLGDFYRRHALNEDASAEYAFLAWLLPQAPEPQVLIAETFLTRGNWELGLQTYEHLLQKQSFQVARHLFALRLAQLSGRPEIPPAQLRARVRRNGLLDDAGSVLVLVRTLEGHAPVLTRMGGFPDSLEKDLETWGAPTFSSGTLGMEMVQHAKTEDLVLRFFQNALTGLRFLPPARHQVVVVRNLWTPEMTVQTLELTQRPGYFQYVSIPAKGDLPEPRFFEKKIVPVRPR